MTLRSCPRCHTPLEVEDQAALIYCFACGAPQVLLSEELRTLAQEQQSLGTTDGAAAQALATEDAAAVRWRPMMGMAAAVSACFAIFALVLPPLALIAPAVTLALYTGRFRSTRISASLGARIGLLCGLLVTAIAGVLGSFGALLLRLRTNELAAFDAALSAQIQQTREQAAARSADAAAALNVFNIPEFRAGIALGGTVLAIAVFLVATTVAGAIAGYARSRTAPQLKL